MKKISYYFLLITKLVNSALSGIKNHPTTKVLIYQLRKFKILNILDYSIQNHFKIFSLMIGIVIFRFFLSQCNNQYVLHPITMPEKLEKMGYSSQHFSELVYNRVIKITKWEELEAKQSSRGSVMFALIGSNKKDIVQLPENYDNIPYNIYSISRIFKKMFRLPDKVIEGALVLQELQHKDKSLMLNLKIDGQLEQITVPAIANLDSLVQLSAETIAKRSQPLLYARWYVTKHKNDPNQTAQKLTKTTYGEYLMNKKSIPEEEIQYLVTEVYLKTANDKTVCSNTALVLTIARCDSALAICDILMKKYPHDIAGFALKAAVLKYQNLQIQYFIKNCSKMAETFQKTLKDTLVNNCQKGLTVCKSYEQLENNWFCITTSHYFAQSRAQSILASAHGYFLYNTNSDFEAAEKKYKEAIKCMPDNNYIYNDYVYCLLNFNNVKEAYEWLQYCMKRYPNDGNLKDTMKSVMDKDSINNSIQLTLK